MTTGRDRRITEATSDYLDVTLMTEVDGKPVPIAADGRESQLTLFGVNAKGELANVDTATWLPTRFGRRKAPKVVFARVSLSRSGYVLGIARIDLSDRSTSGTWDERTSFQFAPGALVIKLNLPAP